ncbi:TIGR01212 family radical SAM protein [Frisingicoccus sp.]|uniref:TIGR01212 family radical SAM protein n=1 Tax=Frisingicoccus sp. TaxID=1918627 RepID=UPI00399C26EF
MGRDYLYYKYSDFLKKHYLAKVYKLPVNLPVTCPNRVNGQGCSFCAESGTGFEAMSSEISVTEQLIKTQEYIRRRYKAQKFIAYFQNYTNTYLPLEKLREYMEEAAKLPDIVEIAISTRPDCIREDYLDMMEEIAAAFNISIGIELGLQTANYHTLKEIRRGHGLAEYLDACLRIQKRDFLLCTHIILNLPGDTLDDVIETGKIISIMGNHLVKAHSLYIARETEMARLFENGRLTIGSKEDYFLRLQTFLEYLSPDIAVERLFSRIPEEDALFSNWQTSWWKLQDEFLAHMEAQKSFQGKRYDYRNGPALKIFDGR